MEYPKIKVCVRCFTFNQAKYIEDTMNGFVMQQTDFPFVCCIVDDASTDGEQDVIKKYMDMHFDYSPNSVSFEKETDYAYIHYAQHKENKNCYFAVVFLKMNLYSKKEGFKKFEYISEWRDICEYEAICEGDDFWIDTKKLSKQVSFLDTHPDYGFSYAKAYSCNESSVINKDVFYGKKKETFDDLIEGNTIPTLTVIYRKKLYDLYRKEIQDNPAWIMGDYPMWLFFIIHSKVYFYNEFVGVYRILPESASHSSSLKKRLEFIRGIFEVQKDLILYAHRSDLYFLICRKAICEALFVCAYEFAVFCKLKKRN